MDLLYKKVRSNNEQVLKLVAQLREKNEKMEERLSTIE